MTTTDLGRASQRSTAYTAMPREARSANPLADPLTANPLGAPATGTLP